MPSHSDQPSVQRSSHVRRAGAVLAGGLCVTAAVAIWALITGSFDSTSLRVLATALAAALATLSGLAGAAVLEREDQRPALGQATMVVSAIALLLAVVLIWIPTAEDSQVILRAFWISLTAMIACAHASLMYRRLRSEDGDAPRALTKLAVGFASAAALLMSSLLVLVTDEVPSGVWRLLGVLVVIAVLMTLLAPLARRMTSARAPANRPTQRRRPRRILARTPGSHQPDR